MSRPWSTGGWRPKKKYYLKTITSIFTCTNPKIRFQNKVLRHLFNAPWYIRNNDLHRDLQVDVVSSKIQSFAQKHEERLHHHKNLETIELLDNKCIVRRLQRIKPSELV
jgi:hypothetical protein